MTKRRPNSSVALALPALIAGYSTPLQASDAINHSDNSEAISPGNRDSKNSAAPEHKNVANATQDLSANHYPAVKIDLNKVENAEALQVILDSMASDECPNKNRVGCRWRVLSLERSYRNAADISPIQLPATNKTPLNSDLAPNEAAPTQSTPSGKRFSNNVPAGFEALAAQNKSEVDIYVNKQLHTRAAINFDSATFSFIDPVKVTRSIEILGLGDPGELGDFIHSEQPVNSSDICIDDDGPLDCLTRAPRNYAFLPNIAAQRVDLIARISNQNFRSEELELIPPAKTSFSLRAGAKGSAAYISNNDNTADLFATASMSYGAGGIFTDASYSNEDRLTRLNTLFFAHQFREHRLQIGTIEQINSDFLLNQRLIGTRWSRSFNTVIDKQALFTTPIEVELPIRSIVQLVVDGVVRSSEELDAGLQIVDASNLPEGTYNLEIRIRDATNGLRVINQIYTRSRILPPVNHTTYGFIAGKTRNNDIDNQLPEPDENNYFSSTISTRLGNQSGATLTASQFNDSGTAELALSRIGNRYQLQISGIVGKHSALGSALKAGFNGKSLGVSIHGMMFESDRDLTGDLELRRFLLPDTQRGGIGLNWRHKRYSLSLRADRQRTTVDQETETRNQFSTTLSRRLGSVQGNNRISVRFADDEDTQRVELKLTLQAKDNNLNHGLRLSYGKVNNQDWEPQIAYNAVFEPGSADGFPDATRWIGGFETTARESRSTLGVSALVVNPHFDLGLRTSVTDEQSDELTWRTLVSASSQIVSDGGAPVMGRFSRQSAGVIVDVAGEPGGENFDIVVNGQRRGVGQIGTRQFISLSDYHTHKIELIPRSIVFNGFDKPLDPFTLYPGNVSRIELSAANNYLLITKLVDRAGNILSDVIIRNGDSNYFVLNDGVVQIEVKSLQVLDVDLGDGEVCSFEAPDPQGEDIVFSTAPLLCLS